MDNEICFFWISIQDECPITGLGREKWPCESRGLGWVLTGPVLGRRLSRPAILDTTNDSELVGDFNGDFTVI